MREQLERDIKIIDNALLDLNELENGIPIKTIDSLHIERARLKSKLSKLYNADEQQDTDLLKESIDLVSKAEELAFKTSITDRQSLSNQFFRLKNRLGALKHKGKVKEQREFKNKDFHVKVWQDSERIGIETVWIREGYFYATMGGIEINHGKRTVLYPDELPLIGMSNCVSVMLKSEIIGYSYSDIVTELEKAHKLSRVVSIWDVIEECEGVTEADKLIEVLGKYEINLSNKYNRYSDEWFELVEHKEVISDPVSFVYRGYQLRLKEQK